MAIFIITCVITANTSSFAVITKNGGRIIMPSILLNDPILWVLRNIFVLFVNYNLWTCDVIIGNS